MKNELMTVLGPRPTCAVFRFVAQYESGYADPKREEIMPRVMVMRRGDEKDGLPRQCVASLDAVIPIDKKALTAQLTSLMPAKLAAVDRALKFALGLP
jgi:hypothetical protein